MTLELWGGCEATVHRLQEQFFDQTTLTGHDVRPDDIDRFASLGLKAIRYPILWERTQPERDGACDFTWADDRMRRLAERGVEPIVGLVHHGGGPRWTNLLDPDFVRGLADFARRTAERFPAVLKFTPVNEPLTTARFSGLYGHWHPHKRREEDCLRMLVVQVRAVRAAMRAIREVTPDAALVQTEDLGKTYATSRLAYQAEFDNARRWLTFDLLCGMVDRDHPLRARFDAAGLSDACDSLVDDPCPPDIVGANHYLTSERWLDHRDELYPGVPIGGNGRDSYVDIEAVRALESTAGPERLLRELWERYRIPVAVTEAHNGCTREEMLRWFMEIWRACAHLRDDGADIRAVTVWAMLGGFDWSSLLTRMEGRYEAGVWDIRASPPHETALARLLRALADGREPDEPTLHAPGWWRRDDRFLGPRVSVGETGWRPLPPAPPARPIVLFGANGVLGQAFQKLCAIRGLDLIATTREACDAADARSAAAVVAEARPWAVINAAGYVRVDAAESEMERCRRENVTAAVSLAQASSAVGARFLTFSSDLVFDGSKRNRYVETDAPAPLSVYGATKAAAEAAVLSAAGGSLIVRASAFFSAWDPYNFATHVRDCLRGGREVLAANDVTVSPTYVPDLVNVSLDLLIDGASGIWHVANDAALTWADFAEEIALELGLDRGPLTPAPHTQLGWVAKRPLYSALASTRGAFMSDLGPAIRHFAREDVAGLRCAFP